MSQILQVDSGQSINLGDPFDLLESFTELDKHTQNLGQMPELFGLIRASMENRPVSARWWEKARQQAVSLQKQIESQLSEPARQLLRKIASSK